MLNTLRLLDGGIAASLARFYAIHAANDERVDAGRLLVGSLLFLAFLGLVLSAAMYPLAPTIVDLLDIPASLHGEATLVIRWVPVLAALALMGESTSALLVGHGRFKALAVTMWASAGAFAAAVVVFVDPGAHLDTLMVATAFRFVILVAANLLFGARHVSIRWPFVPSVATTREVGGYSSRMQVRHYGLRELGGGRLVIAAVLPVSTWGCTRSGSRPHRRCAACPYMRSPAC